MVVKCKSPSSFVLYIFSVGGFASGGFPCNIWLFYNVSVITYVISHIVTRRAIGVGDCITGICVILPNYAESAVEDSELAVKFII